MKTILATTDFTAASWNAVSYAAKLALDGNAKLVLLHATHIPVVSDSFFDLGFTLEELEKADKEQMQVLNEKLKAKFGPGLKVEKQVKIGFAGELIQEKVAKGEVDLVVMGIGHMDKFSEVVFGSTSTAMAGNINCPVLIVPEKCTYRPWKKVAFAFDQKQIPTGTGLRTLRALKDVFGSAMHYVHVMDSPYAMKDDGALKPVYKVLADKDPKLHFLNSIPNKTAEIIQDWIRRYRANAVVLVSRQHGVLWRLFNERTTKKIAFTSSVPVLVIAEQKQR